MAHVFVLQRQLFEWVLLRRGVLRFLGVIDCLLWEGPAHVAVILNDFDALSLDLLLLKSFVHGDRRVAV